MVGPGFDPTDGHNARGSPQGWLLDAGGFASGRLWHAGYASQWEGRADELKEGDVVVRLPSAPPALTSRG